jgi:hypothetical protein
VVTEISVFRSRTAKGLPALVAAAESGAVSSEAPGTGGMGRRAEFLESTS